MSHPRLIPCSRLLTQSVVRWVRTVFNATIGLYSMVPPRLRPRARAQLPRLERAQLRQQHLVGRARVLRVQFEDGALEVLHGIGLAVQRADFGELVGDRVALLGEAAVALPVGAELAAQRMAGLGKGARIVGVGVLVRGALRVLLLIAEGAELG